MPAMDDYHLLTFAKKMEEVLGWFEDALLELEEVKDRPEVPPVQQRLEGLRQELQTATKPLDPLIAEEQQQYSKEEDWYDSHM